MRPPGRDDTDADLEWIQLSQDEAPSEESETFELLPENLQAWEVFVACSTQWLVGFGGATGLNYPAMESVMRMNNIPDQDQQDVFWRVRCIERGALAAMNEKRNHG